MTVEFNASELFKKIIWRRLGNNNILSDNQFENILYSLIAGAFRTPHNTYEILELHKFKNYSKLFYFSGPCMENRLYAYVSKSLKTVGQPQVEEPFDSATPIIYTYTSRHGIIPVARRATVNATDLIEDEIAVQGSSARQRALKG